LALGTKEKIMRLREVLNEDLHQTLDQLKIDAAGLEQSGVIELVPDWEDNLPKLLHRYEAEKVKIWNSFSDPDYKDEDEFLETLLTTTVNFLITHGLATKK